MEDKHITLLTKLSFLEGVGPELAKRLAESATELTFQPGQILLQEGSVGRDVMVILEGQVEVIKGQGEKQMVIDQRGVGEVFGEMGFIESRPRFATIRALEPTRVLVLSEHSMRTVLAEQPDLLFRTTQMLSARLRSAQEQMIANLQHKNEELERAYHELQEAQAALVVKERMERELELARELQDSFLPHQFPDIPGISLAARSQPAREVGGDFYDVISLGKNRLGLVIADVSDKGMPAALFMALTRSLIRAEARRSASPRKVLLNTHRMLMEVSEASMFVTIFYGVLDLTDLKLTYTRAGHDRPILFTPSTCESRFLTGTGSLLGMIEEITLEEMQAQLEPGQMLVLYTDGITDVNSPQGEFFGAQRLQETICAAPTSNAQALCDAIFACAQEFQAGTKQYDDMSLLIIGVDQKFSAQ